MELPAITKETPIQTAGTRAAVSHRTTLPGRGGTNMFRLALTVLMVVVPGGLLVLAAFVLARTVAAQMAHEQGTHGRRFARAVASVRLRDVWSNARASLR
jgi:hypothetical protein